MNASARPCPQPPPPEALQLRDVDWQRASVARALRHWDGRSDLWVFGYGSLIWHPDFDYLESCRARIHGYHRALCMWSRINRGTPQRPGLVFSLDLGGSCTGMAFRVDGRRARDTMLALWIREMPSASYIPRWLNCHTAQGTVRGLVFTMDRVNESFVPGLTLEQTVRIVRAGHGRYGSCTDYVLQTASALRAAGIADHGVQRIAQALRGDPMPGDARARGTANDDDGTAPAAQPDLIPGKSSHAISR